MGYLPWTVACCLLAAMTWQTTKGGKPNIILMLADDLGTADLSFTDPEMKTPQLERLANMGRRMTNVYTMDNGLASRVALMTSKYPWKSGLQPVTLSSRWWVNKGSDSPILPEALQELRYSTWGIGRWGLGHCSFDVMPEQRGFDKFYGHLGNVNQGYFNHSGPEEGTLDFRLAGEETTRDVIGSYATTLHTNKAVELIEAHNPKKKFFLYMSYQNPHAPYEADEGSLNRCSHVTDDARKTHCAMVAAMDKSVGRILDALEAKSLMDNTVILFMSDNGGPVDDPDAPTGSYNYPYRGGKGTFWEGGVRSEGIFVWPAKVNASSAPWGKNFFHILDVFPTLYSAAAGAANARKLRNKNDMDGLDLLSKVVKGSGSIRKTFVVGMEENRAAVRMQHYKLIVGRPGGNNYASSWLVPPSLRTSDLQSVVDTKSYGNQHRRMYNLKNDPQEKKDLYGDPKKLRFQDKLEAFLTEQQALLAKNVSSIVEVPEADTNLYSGIVSPGWCCPCEDDL